MDRRFQAIRLTVIDRRADLQARYRRGAAHGYKLASLAWADRHGNRQRGAVAPVVACPTNATLGGKNRRWLVQPCRGRWPVFITDRIDGRERTVAFDADTGRELWAQEHPVDFDPHAVGRRHGNGPKSTPLVDGDCVYSLGIAGWLECFDAATGKSRWHIHFPAAYGRRETITDGRAYVNGETSVVVPVGNGQGAPVPLFGFTGSLTLAGPLLIAPVGGDRAGTIQAFDKLSGAVVWRALQENVSYSSPVVAPIAGVEQVVVMTGPRVVGLALSDGRLLWSHPFQIQYDESISTPVISGDTVLVSGDGHPLTALAISRTGDKQTAKLAWENYDLTSYLSSMIAHGGHVYGMSDPGQFGCVRLSDGKTLWQQGQHGYYCTPLIGDGRLLALNERGQLSAIAADPLGYKLLGQSRLTNSATWTSPAIVGNLIYVRGYQTLRCFDL